MSIMTKRQIQKDMIGIMQDYIKQVNPTQEQIKWAKQLTEQILEYTLDGIKSSIRAWHAFVLQDRGVFIASLKNTIPSPLPIGTNFDMNLKIFITKDDNDEDLKSIEIFDNKEKIYSTTSVVEYDNYIDVLSVKGIDEKERVYKFVLTYELNGKIKTRENVLVVKTQQ